MSGIRLPRVKWALSWVVGAIAVTALAAKAEVRTAFLATGESQTYINQFSEQEDIYADCDANCSDIDMYLYDTKTDKLVASDTLLDPYPFVTTPYAGEFRIEVVMVTCLVDVCEVWTDSNQGF
jgi:hypothetical protein